MGFFSKTLDKLKGALKKTAEVLNTDVRTLFIPGRQIDEQFLAELEEKFLQADMGVQQRRPHRHRAARALAAGQDPERRGLPGRRPRAAAGQLAAAGPRAAARRRPARRSSWSPASTAPARPPASPSWPGC